MPTQNPQLELTKLVAQYSERFGHGVPMDVSQTASTPELTAQIKRALENGQAISGWSEKPMFSTQPKTEQPTDDPEEVKAFQRHRMKGVRRA